MPMNIRSGSLRRWDLGKTVRRWVSLPQWIPSILLWSNQGTSFHRLPRDSSQLHQLQRIHAVRKNFVSEWVPWRRKHIIRCPRSLSTIIPGVPAWYSHMTRSTKESQIVWFFRARSLVADSVSIKKFDAVYYNCLSSPAVWSNPELVLRLTYKRCSENRDTGDANNILIRLGGKFDFSK